jgi:hypothetical protein
MWAPVVSCLRNAASLVILRMAPKKTAQREPMTAMDVASSIHALRASGAAFRNKVCAWAMMAAALPVTVVSLLIGISPYDVEDTQGNFIPCGHTLFHTSPSPSPLCEAHLDPWRVIAEAGLFIAACMVLAAIVFGIRSSIAQRATGAPAVSRPLPRE